jgi:ABC-type lipoprotein release transport system permease subunit
MYKLLLCWRYLRTRYIALASIISVTLGVATMIVVNSVMAGFTTEMENRIHGILSDVVLESTSLEGMPDAQWHMEQIRAVAGQWIEAMTPTVAVPAMLSFQVPYGSGKWITRPVYLIGIDAATQGQVSDFSKYLQHPENRRQLSWELRHEGYDIRDPQGGADARHRPQMAAAGWPHRIRRARYEEMLRWGKPSSAPSGPSRQDSSSPGPGSTDLQQPLDSPGRQQSAGSSGVLQSHGSSDVQQPSGSSGLEPRVGPERSDQAPANPIRVLSESDPGRSGRVGVGWGPKEPGDAAPSPAGPSSGLDLPSPLRSAEGDPRRRGDPRWNETAERIGRDGTQMPSALARHQETPERIGQTENRGPSSPPADSAGGSEPSNPAASDDPFASRIEQQTFDPTRQQHTGAVLGMGLVSFRDAEGDDRFVLLPGDDVKLTFPTAGTPPKAISDTFTIVDLYESKMSEYDSQFVFVPIEKLQELRGMIDPATGARLVSSIQIKLKPGVDGAMVRDLLRAKFRPELYAVFTWRDKQGPLLAAVQMETAILNVLLFLIICVSGFGILAIFFMIVVEKTRDIGILKSLGASSRGVMGIFLSYGLLLGVTGSVAGLILGLLFVRYINQIADWLGKLTGRPLFDPQIYYFYKIPTMVQPTTVTWIISGAVVIAVLASVLPALRAAMLRPVDALRYE